MGETDTRPRDQNRCRALVMTVAGHMLRASGLPEDAEAAYLEALRAGSDHAGTHQGLANALAEQGKEAEALTALAGAARIRPFTRHKSELLVRMLHWKNRSDDALAVLERWVATEPDDPVARHMLAAAGARAAPERASDEYLRETFNGFAESFDHVLKLLDYRGPQLLADAIAAAIGAPRSSLSVLDAGCGTGLSGELLAPYAHRLTGVDLSPGMLEFARQRCVYDELVEAELTQYLAERKQAFDLIGAADSLIYFGTLETVLSTAYGALRPAGWMVFTVEALDEPTEGRRGYRLESHGRYRHGRDYLRRAAMEVGFETCEITEAVLRREADAPVVGLVATLHRSTCPVSRPALAAGPPARVEDLAAK